jgi:hypothetical protein
MASLSAFRGSPYGYTLGDPFGSTGMIPEQDAFIANGGNEYPTTNTSVRRTVEIEHPVSESHPDDTNVALVNPHLGWKVGHLMFCRTTMNNEYEHATLIQLNEWMAQKAEKYYSQKTFKKKDARIQCGLLYGLFFKFRPFGILIAYRTIGGPATLFNTNSQVINCGLVHSLIKIQNYAGQNMGPNLRLILIGRFVKLAPGQTMHFESKTEIGQYTSITNKYEYDMCIPQFYVHVNHSKHAPLNVEGGLPEHLCTEFKSTINETGHVPTVRAYIGCVYPDVTTPFSSYDTTARVEGDLDDPVRKNSACQSWGQNSVNIEFTKTYNISITDDENTETKLASMMKSYPFDKVASDDEDTDEENTNSRSSPPPSQSITPGDGKDANPSKNATKKTLFTPLTPEEIARLKARPPPTPEEIARLKARPPPTPEEIERLKAQEKAKHRKLAPSYVPGRFPPRNSQEENQQQISERTPAGASNKLSDDEEDGSQPEQEGSQSEQDGSQPDKLPVVKEEVVQPKPEVQDQPGQEIIVVDKEQLM